MTDVDLCASPEEGRPLVYLACPFSHRDVRVMRQRYQVARNVCVTLMKRGRNTFSPINHPGVLPFMDGCVNREGPHLPTGWAFWKGIDFAYIDCSYVLAVLTLEGWRDSTGVQAEIEYAGGAIPIRYLDPKTLIVYHDPRYAIDRAPGDVPALPGRDEKKERGLLRQE